MDTSDKHLGSEWHKLSCHSISNPHPWFVDSDTLYPSHIPWHPPSHRTCRASMLLEAFSVCSWYIWSSHDFFVKFHPLSLPDQELCLWSATCLIYQEVPPAQRHTGQSIMIFMVCLPSIYLHQYHQHADPGPISSVTVFGTTLILVNDRKVAFELLDNRSAIHSSRMVMTFAGEMWALTLSEKVLLTNDLLLGLDSAGGSQRSFLIMIPSSSIDVWSMAILEHEL